MRPLEIILVAGALLLLLGWAAGRRWGRPLPWALLAVAVVHLGVEGQRVAMWPVYAVVVASARAALIRSGPRPPARRGVRAAGRWVLALALLLVLAPLPVLWPVMKLPRPGGSHPVGQTVLVVVDSSRRERFATGQAVRRFPVKVWYPASASASGPTAVYGDPREVGAPGMPPGAFGHVRLIRTHATIDAPIAPGERLPVLIFSHGYGGNYGQNTIQMEELASHGYLVASIAHPGEASWAPFPDGAGIPMDSGIIARLRRQADSSSMRKALELLARLDSASTPEARLAEFRTFLAGSEEPLRSESVAEWAADTRALVDRLTSLDQAGTASPFQGRLDLARLGVFGMSYGGATAGEFCRQDVRCKAAVNIDGGQYGGLINDSLLVPLLIMASSQAYSIHPPVLELTRGPAYLIKVPETTHVGLTDLSLMAPRALRWAGITGKLDPDRRERIMNAYLVGFFDTHLRGRRSPLFDGPAPEFPEVSFVRRNVP